MKNVFLLPLIILSFVLSGCSQKINQKVTKTVQKVTEIQEAIVPKPTIIESDNLPNKYLIKTVFVPQAPEKNWDEPWQDACEEAAILTVHYYYQHQAPDTHQIVADLTNLFQTEANLGFTSDVNVTQMATMSAKLYNYHSQVIDHPTLEIIKSYISRNIPVITPSNGKTLFQENSHFKAGGPWYHNLVILGYDDDKKQFIVHDVGTQAGAYFHYSYNLLLKANHDFPTSGRKEDIDQGDQKMLVLLK